MSNPYLKVSASNMVTFLVEILLTDIIILTSGIYYNDLEFIDNMKWSQCLVKIHHHTVTIIFLVMRTFKISPSNFQINNAVKLTIITMLCITSQDLIIFQHGLWNQHAGASLAYG